MKFLKKFYWVGVLMMGVLLTSASKPSSKLELVKIETPYGNILVYLYDATPLHKANFLKLAKEHYYDGTTFHRVIQNFMIQGGDPNSKDTLPYNDGEGGPGYTIPAEFNPNIIHRYGAIAAAREGDQVNPKKESSGSQFYIVKGKKYTSAEIDQFEKRIGKKFTDAQRTAYSTVGGTPHLDGAYTVFGEVVSGMDAVEKISAVAVAAGSNRPLKNIKMEVEVVKMTEAKLKKKYNFAPQIK